ncbi:MAG TPA: hypothetical protein VHY59_06210, partial [Chthoniobacterales bacterium]|nr:hypothetical protein [Chthoniobacterales bacterium]
MTKTIPILSRNNAENAGIAVNDQSPITNHQSPVVPARLPLGPIAVLLITIFFATALQAAPLSQDEISDLVKRLETV